MIKKLVIAVVLAAGAAGAWYYFVRGAPEDAGRRVLYGNVDIRQVDLGFRVAGRIATLGFEEGTMVKTGAVMAELDDKPFKDDLRIAEAEVASKQANLKKYLTGSRPAEIAQARALVTERLAALANADQVLERQEQLVKRGFASRQNYDDALARKKEAQARLASARELLSLSQEGFREEDIAVARAGLLVVQARLERAQTNLADTKLIAPNDGVVLNRIEEPGAIVGVGAPVYTLSLTGSVWVRTYIAEPDLGTIHPGLKVRIVTDSAPDRPYLGHVGFISPVAEFTPKTVQTADLRTDLVYRLRVIVDDADNGLRQGMPVTVLLAPVEAQ